MDKSDPRACKRCGKCKPASEFYRAIGSICFKCQTKRKNQNILKRGQTLKLSAITNAGGVCMDCGIDLIAHPEIADFDHRPGEPRTTNAPSQLSKINKARFLAEIESCDIVCANCHRIRTRFRLLQSLQQRFMNNG